MSAQVGKLRRMQESPQRPRKAPSTDDGQPPRRLKKVRKRRVPRAPDAPKATKSAPPRKKVVRKRTAQPHPVRPAPAPAPAPALRPQDQARGEGQPQPSYDLIAVLGGIARQLTTKTLPRIAGTVARWTRRAMAIAGAGARALWRHREVIGGVATRMLWWASLVLLAVVGRALLGGDAHSPWLEGALTWFCIGLGACTVVTLAARPRHLRIAGAALATGHGAFALLHYLTTTGLS